MKLFLLSSLLLLGASTANRSTLPDDGHVFGRSMHKRSPPHDGIEEATKEPVASNPIKGASTPTKKETVVASTPTKKETVMASTPTKKESVIASTPSKKESVNAPTPTKKGAASASTPTKNPTAATPPTKMVATPTKQPAVVTTAPTKKVVASNGTKKPASPKKTTKDQR
jgi:hypothetical protein